MNDPLVEELRQILSPLAGWLSRIDAGDPSDFGPAAGSSLHGDDNHTDPYQVSHAVWHSLSHALDHLHCLEAVIYKAGTINMYAPYTLLRAAIENAATAVWLLGPANRSERILCRLQLAAMDCRNGDNVQKAMGTTPQRPVNDRLDRIRALATARGLDPRQAVKWVGWEAVVTAAANVLSPGSSFPVVLWRACSGVTHGDLWATIGVTDHTEIGGDAKVTRRQVQANVTFLREATRVAVGLTELGWALYDKRAAAPW